MWSESHAETSFSFADAEVISDRTEQVGDTDQVFSIREPVDAVQDDIDMEVDDVMEGNEEEEEEAKTDKLAFNLVEEQSEESEEDGGSPVKLNFSWTPLPSNPAPKRLESEQRTFAEPLPVDTEGDEPEHQDSSFDFAKPVDVSMDFDTSTEESGEEGTPATKLNFSWEALPKPDKSRIEVIFKELEEEKQNLAATLSVESEGTQPEPEDSSFGFANPVDVSMDLGKGEEGEEETEINAEPLKFMEPEPLDKNEDSEDNRYEQAPSFHLSDSEEEEENAMKGMEEMDSSKFTEQPVEKEETVEKSDLNEDSTVHEKQTEPEEPKETLTDADESVFEEIIEKSSKTTSDEICSIKEATKIPEEDVSEKGRTEVIMEEAVTEEIAEDQPEKEQVEEDMEEVTADAELGVIKSKGGNLEMEVDTEPIQSAEKTPVRSKEPESEECAPQTGNEEPIDAPILVVGARRPRKSTTPLVTSSLRSKVQPDTTPATPNTRKTKSKPLLESGSARKSLRRRSTSEGPDISVASAREQTSVLLEQELNAEDPVETPSAKRGRPRGTKSLKVSPSSARSVSTSKTIEQSVLEVIESAKLGTSSKRGGRRLSKADNSSQVEEPESAKLQTPAKHESRRLSKADNSPQVKELESTKLQTPAKRESRRLSKANVSPSPSRSVSKKKSSVSPQAEEPQPANLQTPAKRAKSRLSKADASPSPARSASKHQRPESTSGEEEPDATPRRSTRSSSSSTPVEKSTSVPKSTPAKSSKTPIVTPAKSSKSPTGTPAKSSKKLDLLSEEMPLTPSRRSRRFSGVVAEPEPLTPTRRSRRRSGLDPETVTAPDGGIIIGSDRKGWSILN